MNNSLSLKTAREKAGLTQKVAAKILGIGEITLSRWENGITSPSIDDVPSIRKAYNLTEKDILALINQEAS